MSARKILSPNREVRELLALIERVGHEVRRGGRHIKVVHSETGVMTTVPVTPSDWRSLKNKRAQLRKLGFIE